MGDFSRIDHHVQVLRPMAKCSAATQWQGRRAWSDTNLEPHRIKSFKISNDPDSAEKVMDVVGLYMNPQDQAMVLSVDQKTRIQAHNDQSSKPFVWTESAKGFIQAAERPKAAVNA